MLEALTKGRANADDEFETLIVFGLMTFGAAASEWSDELFMRRTGIALSLWEKGVGRPKII